MTRWGALPRGEQHTDKPRRCECGQVCPPNYEHCDDCLMAAVRGINAVDRAVKERNRAADNR